MADALISKVLEQLTSIIEREIRQEVRLVVGVRKEVQNLSSTLRAIQAVLVDAQKRQVTENVVKVWLENLKDISYDIDNVLDEWSTAILKLQIEGLENAPISLKKKVCSYIPSPFFCFSRLVLRHDIAIKIKDLNTRLDVISSEKDKYNFKLSTNIEKPVRQETTSFVDILEVYGRDQDKKIIVSKLLCESSQEERGLRIISIVGMGGIGKTTLAQLAYNDDSMEAHFDKKIWVCVSDPLDETSVAKAIIEALEGNAPNFFALETLLRRIQKSILNKKFLLVLDDVWTGDYEKWEPSMQALKYGSQGSRILVTTRNENVVKAMGATYMHPLGKLSDEECWSLFSGRAFFGRGKEEQEKLKETGRKIADKCKGLPLAAKTLGSLMRFKKTEQEWKNILGSEIWELEEAEKGVFPPLLLSFYDLPSVVKQCFLYCVVFPKDYKIETNELIRLWMAQGYLSSSQSAKLELELVGQEYFENLVARSFFQGFEKNKNDGSIISCKMHDIMHDFAQFLTKNECFIMEVDGGKESSKDSLHWKGRHSTIILARNAEFPVSIYNRENLYTLFVMPALISREISNILRNLFRGLKCLRALHLSKLSIEELPQEVGNLVHLRYLNLSRNTFKKLPQTLCDLCNLQTLNLSDCSSLEELPQGMGKLINLRHLDTSSLSSSIRFMPRGIGRLSSLRTLTDFIVSGGDDREGCKLEDLKNLNQLRGRLTIRGFRNLVAASEAEKAELKSKKDLNHLILDFYPEGRMESMEEIIEALQPHSNLECLVIRYYGGTKFPKWMASVTRLRKLELHFCSKFMHLPPLGKLPSLESLQISINERLKNVGIEFLGLGKDIDGAKASPIIAFPELKVLWIGGMHEWEEWDMMITGRSDEISIMPCLCSLSIWFCPKLKALPHHIQTLPLEELEIRGCPILQQRYQEGIGEDWTNISHIPNIEISDY